MAYQWQLHTHTWRCKHATGEVVDYARLAAAGGCPVLGVSDHMPHPDGRWADVRMSLSQLDEYETAIAEARQEVPGLTIRAGLECEYLPELDAFYRDELFGRRGYDYLIGAGHYIELDEGWRGSFEHLRTPEALRRYAAMLTRMMESRLFAFIAHPDLLGCCNQAWTDEVAACVHDICAASIATGTPLELNAYGLRKSWFDTPEGRRPGYPWGRFWDVAATHDVRVVLSSDAHRPVDVLHGHDELTTMCRDRGLQEADLGPLVRPDHPLASPAEPPTMPPAPAAPIV